MEIYNEKYFNRRNYILEHINETKLSPKEALIILMIDFNNEFKINTTPDSISKACNIELKETNEIIYNLCQKGLIQLVMKNKHTSFNIDAIFDHNKINLVASDDIFSLFSEEFKRPLNQKETILLGEWVRKYSFEELVNALKNASIYKKLNFSYIERILAHNEQ